MPYSSLIHGSSSFLVLLETGIARHRVKTEKGGEEFLLAYEPERTHSQGSGRPRVARALSNLFIYSPLPGLLPEGNEWMKDTHQSLIAGKIYQVTLS